MFNNLDGWRRTIETFFHDAASEERFNVTTHSWRFLFKFGTSSVEFGFEGRLNLNWWAGGKTWFTDITEESDCRRQSVHITFEVVSFQTV
ncbi:MAG: hypothetical protein ACTS80_01310 [Candidatus Hodgkinia cicadicola]